MSFPFSRRTLNCMFVTTACLATRSKRAPLCFDFDLVEIDLYSESFLQIELGDAGLA